MTRPATPNDAPEVARLIIPALGDLATRYINGKGPDGAIDLFERFAAMPANQFSYQNILVFEDEGGVYGMISGYDGADWGRLRAPFLQYIRSAYGFSQIQEDETQAGEFYIDCLSVSPDQQGKGIGKQLINALIGKAGALAHTKIGLLVSDKNPLAEKLYLGLGFERAGKKHLLGGNYYHMQYTVSQ